MKPELKKYKEEVGQELEEILAFWMTAAVDEQHGGFFGSVNNENIPHRDAAKGSVLHSRILWAFSAALEIAPGKNYASMATRAYAYLCENFIDRRHGGVYWTVTAKGEPLETKKQVYAIAFALYACSEYYRTHNDEKAKDTSLALYDTLIDRCYDKINGGFWEGFSINWKELPDQRLSSKDANERKSMNTNLHVLEAFANLYSVWPDASLKKHIVELLDIFKTKIIGEKSHHLSLFFNDEWMVKPDVISYGHDIEASWLLLDAAMIINDRKLIEEYKNISLLLADAAIEGISGDGGLWYEYDPSANRMVREKHWWLQAEAMVGFLNAWQISNDEKYLEHSLRSWDFVKKYLIDRQHGEWYWGVDEHGAAMPLKDKAGLWKCPYHNSRACMEVMKRIASLMG